MIYRLPLRLRQALAVALLLAAISLTAILTIVPFLTQLATARERLEQERTVLGRLQDAARTMSVAEQLEQAARNPQTTGLFISGESEAIRLASLQSQVTDILTAHAVKPRTSRNLQSRERHTLKLVGVQLQLTASIEQLQRILLDIEAHRPILLVDSLHLTSASLVNADDDRGLLEARLDVVAIEARPLEVRPAEIRPTDIKPSDLRQKAP